MPYVTSVTITGPYQPQGAGRHAEPPADFRLPARRRPREEAALRRTILHDAGAPRLSRPGRPTRASAELLDFYTRAAPKAAASTPASSWRCAGCSSAPNSCSASKPTRATRRGPRGPRSGAARRGARGVSHQRPRAGVAAVVLPVEQHSRRRAARRWPTQGKLKEPAVLERQVRRMLADPRSEALTKNFAGQWLQLRNMANVAAGRSVFADLRRDAAAGDVGARPSCSSTASCARTAASSRLLTADYTFLNERLARHYGIPNVQGSHFRRVALPADSPRRGLLGHGSILTDDVARHPHLAGVPRQVDSAERPRHAAARSAAQRAGARRQEDAGQGADDARADGAAPREPGVRELSLADRSGRLRAGEFRRDRPLARRSTSRSIRSMRRASCRTARSSTAWPSCARRWSGGRSGSSRRVTEKLLTYALGRGARVLRHAGGAQDRRGVAASATATSFSRSFSGVVKSYPFLMRRAGRSARHGSQRRPHSDRDWSMSRAVDALGESQRGVT